jgi:hemerythrin superfamily protein
MTYRTRDFSGRDLAMMAIGAAAALMAARVLPPLVTQAVGTARGAAGGDPFARLTADHDHFLDLLDAMEETGDDQTFRRTQLLLRLKRGLTAHALAEEDVAYPALEHEVGDIEASRHLYAEHAQMKNWLYELEMIPKDHPAWRDRVRALRRIIASHAREEEEEEFPRLRAALDRRKAMTLSGAMSRERALVL